MRLRRTKHAALSAAVIVCVCVFFYLLFSLFPSYNVMHHAMSAPQCQPDLRTARIRRMVMRVCLVLNSQNISYFLMDGTLLGALHGGDILRTDQDGDIGYFWKDNVMVKRKLGAKFLLRTKAQPTASVDLKRFEVTNNILTRVNAPHESSVLDWAIAKYNSGWRYDDVFPLRVLGGNGPLSECKIPNKAEKLMAEMFGVYHHVNCPYSTLLAWKRQ